MKTKTILLSSLAVTALACAIVPMASYAATDTKNVKIDVAVDSTIDMVLDSNNLSGTVDSGKAKTDLQVKATVTTNAPLYNVTLESDSAVTALTGDYGSIATADGRPVDGSTAQWGACLGNSTTCNDTTNASLDSLWHAIPKNSDSGGTPLSVATGKAKALTESYVTFGFSSGTTPAGDYTNTVLFTATAANVSSN